MNNKNADIPALLADVVDVQSRPDGHYCIVDYAPDSSEYEGGVDGVEWHEECARRLADVRRRLPVGWQAEWVDDDVDIWCADVSAC